MCDEVTHEGVIIETSPDRRGIAVATLERPGGGGSGVVAAGAVVETDVLIPTVEGTADAALFHPEGEGSWPAVLVWPDAMGLRPVFRDLGRRLAADGYVVLVANPFYRVRPAPVLEGSFDFSDPDDRAKLTPLLASITPDGIEEDSRAYFAYLDALLQTDTSRAAGVQGYCMGGPLAFRTAHAVPRVGAVATFHGGGLATDADTSPHLLVPETNAEYLVAVADNDDQADPDAKERLAAALTAAGRPHKVEVYKGAAHGWTVTGSAIYNEEAAEKAWSELLDLYGRALG